MAHASEGTETATPTDPSVAFRSIRKTGPLGIGSLHRYQRVAREWLREPDSVLHDHGLWLPTNHVVARAAGALGRPRIVSVRGMLTAWARRQGQAKKALAWTFYQRRDLLTASALHVTSTAELEAVRELKLGVPLVLIPNGVDVPSAAAEMAAHRPNRVALMLSRLHRGKGGLELIEAWRRTQPVGWRLRIAGPDADGHRQELERAVAEAGLVDQVEFLGAVDDDQKWGIYRSSDLFVLPTQSENFGLSIAEALAAGLPVITTHGAPWRAIADDACGWWIANHPDALEATLREAMSLGPDELRRIGDRGRRLVRRCYAWPAVAEQMEEAYRYLLGGSAAPASIYL